MIINHHDHHHDDDHNDHPSVKIHHRLGQAGGSASLPSLVLCSDFTVPEYKAYHVITNTTNRKLLFFILTQHDGNDQR